MQVIKSIRKATDKEWDSMVDAVESAIYFQTREWFDIWAEYAGFKSDTRLISFESGKKVLLPLSYIALLKGTLKIYFLSPKGMGGFLTNDDLKDNEKRELFKVLEKVKVLYCAVNPYDKLTNEFDRFNSLDFTQMLDLSKGFEPILRNWTKGHHSAAKKGMRDGVTAETAVTENDWKSYFKLYGDTMVRWGKEATNRYTWDLFEIMYKKKSDKIKLWLAKYQGQIISGALCLYQNKHVAYWHSATSEQFLKLNGPHVLQYHIIKNACESGFVFYDFLSSGGHGGVVHFKNGFSPEKIPVHIYMSPLMNLSSAMREKLRNSAVYKLLMKGTGF